MRKIILAGLLGLLSFSSFASEGLTGPATVTGCALSGCTYSGLVTFGAGLNVTASSGYQINGLNTIRLIGTSSSIPGLVAGAYAGNSLGPNATYSTLVGEAAGESLNSNGASESEYFGLATGMMSITGTGVGMGSGCLASETTTVSDACIGADSGRDLWPGGGDTMLGSQLLEDGSWIYTLAAGNTSAGGFASLLKVAGATPTAGDVWTFSFASANPCNTSTFTISSGSYNSSTGAVTLTLSASPGLAVGTSVWVTGVTGTGAFSNANGSFVTITGTMGSTVVYTIATGLTMTITGGSAQQVNCTTAASWPVTATYTVQSGDNSAVNLAASLAAALSGPFTSWSSQIDYVLGDSQLASYRSLFAIIFKVMDATNHAGVIYGHYPATYQLTITATCVGTCGETITYTGPESGQKNVFLGNNILYEAESPSISWNTIGGSYTLGQKTTGAVQNNALWGYTIAPNALSFTYGSIVGANALANATTPARESGVGVYIFPSLTTGTANERWGADATACNTGVSVTTASYTVSIGESDAGSCLNSATANNQMMMSGIMSGYIDGATNPQICVIGQVCIIGELRSANLNSTADQGVVIGIATSGDVRYLPTATKYVVTGMFVDKCSASSTTAAGGLYTAASKGGTALVAAAQSYTGCVSSTTMQTATLAAAAQSNTLTAATLYFSLTTAQGSADTGDVYIQGIPYN